MSWGQIRKARLKGWYVVGGKYAFQALKHQHSWIEAIPTSGLCVNGQRSGHDLSVREHTFFLDAC